VFTEVLNSAAKSIAKASNTAEMETITNIAKTAAASEIKELRSARTVAKVVAYEVKLKVGEEHWDQMKGTAKLDAIKAHADRDSVHTRSGTGGRIIEYEVYESSSDLHAPSNNYTTTKFHATTEHSPLISLAERASTAGSATTMKLRRGARSRHPTRPTCPAYTTCTTNNGFVYFANVASPHLRQLQTTSS
jgi:hypothetical protein